MFKKLISYRVPRNLLVLIYLMGLLLLFSQNIDDPDMFTLVSGLALVLIIYVSNFILVRVSPGDHYIFLIVTMLISLGIIMIYRINPNLGAKQVVWVSIGIVAFFSSYVVVKNINSWDKWIKLYGIASVILFMVTLIFGVTRGGARNWIKIGRFSFQPAELIKLLFIFFIASYYNNVDKYNLDKKGGYKILIAVYIFIGFLFLQKDLGTALVFYLIFLFIQYVY